MDDASRDGMVQLCLCKGSECQGCVGIVRGHVLLHLLDLPSADMDLAQPQFPKETPTTESLDLRRASPGRDLSAVAEVTSTNPNMRTVELKNFLLHLEKREDKSSTRSINTAIYKELTSIMDKSLEILKQKVPHVFHDARMHLVGSVMEGTKLGVFDEFDFNIELPTVEKWLKTDTTWLNWKRNETKDWLARKLMSLHTKHFMKMLGEELMKRLSPDNRALSRFRYVCNSVEEKLSHLLYMQYFPEGSSSHIDVFCDIVFCFPFKLTSEMESILKEHKRVVDVTFAREIHFTIMNGCVSQTHVFQENDKLKNSEVSLEVLRIYRLVKIAIRDLMPPLYDFKRRRTKGLICSYWLKQTILYIMAENPDPSFWQEQNVDVILTKVFGSMKQSFEEKTLNAYFNESKNLMELTVYNIFTSLHQKYVTVVSCLLYEAIQGNSKALTALLTLASASDELKTLVNEEQNNATRLGRMHVFAEAYLYEFKGFFTSFEDKHARKLNTRVMLDIGGFFSQGSGFSFSSGDVDRCVREYVDKCSTDEARLKTLLKTWQEEYYWVFGERLNDVTPFYSLLENSAPRTARSDGSQGEHLTSRLC